jgi:hypothetical protein
MLLEGVEYFRVRVHEPLNGVYLADAGALAGVEESRHRIDYCAIPPDG